MGDAGRAGRAVNPEWVRTPALTDEALVWLDTTPGDRLIISMPPQETKTSTCTQFGSLWALIRDPERRIGIVSYSQGLAENSGRITRNAITTFDGTTGQPIDLGPRIARDNGAVGRWQRDGHRGGCIAAGIGSGLTGRACDLLVLDYPYADKEQAESACYRERVWDWWQAVGSTRLAPGAPRVQQLAQLGRQRRLLPCPGRQLLPLPDHRRDIRLVSPQLPHPPSSLCFRPTATPCAAGGFS